MLSGGVSQPYTVLLNIVVVGWCEWVNWRVYYALSWTAPKSHTFLLIHPRTIAFDKGKVQNLKWSLFFLSRFITHAMLHTLTLWVTTQRGQRFKPGSNNMVLLSHNKVLNAAQFSLDLSCCGFCLVTTSHKSFFVSSHQSGVLFNQPTWTLMHDFWEWKYLFTGKRTQNNKIAGAWWVVMWNLTLVAIVEYKPNSRILNQGKTLCFILQF